MKTRTKDYVYIINDGILIVVRKESYLMTCYDNYCTSIYLKYSENDMTIVLTKKQLKNFILKNSIYLGVL